MHHISGTTTPIELKFGGMFKTSEKSLNMKNQLHWNFVRDFMTFLDFGIIFNILCSKHLERIFIEKINGFLIKSFIIALMTQYIGSIFAEISCARAGVRAHNYIFRDNGHLPKKADFWQNRNINPPNVIQIPILLLYGLI